jgi:hypothetical protein
VHRIPFVHEPVPPNQTVAIKTRLRIRTG